MEGFRTLARQAPTGGASRILRRAGRRQRVRRADDRDADADRPDASRRPQRIQHAQRCLSGDRDRRGAAGDGAPDRANRSAAGKSPTAIRRFPSRATSKRISMFMRSSSVRPPSPALFVLRADRGVRTRCRSPGQAASLARFHGSVRQGRTRPSCRSTSRRNRGARAACRSCPRTIRSTNSSAASAGCRRGAGRSASRKRRRSAPASSSAATAT